MKNPYREQMYNEHNKKYKYNVEGMIETAPINRWP